MPREYTTPQAAIRAYYSRAEPVIRGRHEGRYAGKNVVSKNSSLTEAVILSAINASARESGSPTSVMSNFPHWEWLVQHFVGYRPPEDRYGIAIKRTLERWNCGPGHVIQRLQRALGLPVELLPRGRLINPHRTLPGSVAVNLGVRTWGHGCGSRLEEATIRAIAEWIGSSDLRFVQVGTSPSPLECDQAGETFQSMFKAVAECEFYVGVPSGWMHLASAFSKQCVVIVNVIHAEDVCLPVLEDAGHPDTMWLYPQHLHLCEGTAGPVVKSVSVDTLKDAVAGLLWPHWDHRLATMV